MSQESKFTPGPWCVEGYGEYLHGHTPINAPSHGGLAQVVTQMEGGNRPRDEIELNANARLIAAAPNLYWIAKIIETAYIGGPTDGFHTRVVELAGGNFAKLLIDTISKVELAA